MLLERDAPLGALDDALAAAHAGVGSLVLVGGEAGAGKSSLVRAFLERLPRAVEVCTGACDPLTTPRPLSPLRDHAASGSGPLAGLDIDRGDRNEVFQAALGRLAEAGTSVMVVEDLHWADQATLDFVTYLARRIGTTRTVAIVTCRDDEVGADHPARPVLGHVASLGTTHRLALDPLSPDAVAELAELAAPRGGRDLDPIAVHRATAGNPFFVTEILASGSTLPDTVQDAVLARLSRLSDRERDVVRVVSIAPRSIDLDTARDVSGGDAADVDRAVSAGVLVEHDGQLRFRHELARTAVEQSIPPGLRHDMHRAMIDMLLGADPPDHALIAHHAIRARSPEAIVRHAPVAATAARSRSAIRESVALVRATLEHADRLDDERVAELRLALARDLANLDDATGSIDAARDAERYYRSVGDVAAAAMAMIQIGIGLGRIGRSRDAGAAFRTAVDRLEPLGPSDALARALCQVATGDMLGRHAAEGLAAARRAESVAEAAGTASTQRSIRHVRACLELIGGDPDRGIALLEASADEFGDEPDRLGAALVNLGTGAGEVRRYDVANDALRRAERHGIAHDLDDATYYVRSWIARVEFEQSHWDAATALAEQVDRTVRNRSGYALLTAHGALGRVRVRRGDPDGRPLLERALEASAGHNLQYVWPVACGVAEDHWLRNDHGAATDVVERWYRIALGSDSAWAIGELGFWMWRAGAIDNAPPGAAEPFALQMDGDWAGAAGAWRAIGCPYEVALALADGDVDARLDALAILDELGAKPLADRVRLSLRDAGVDRIPRGPSAATRDHPLGLTRRQAEVWALMADGLSNGQIAERLYVSKKTVEHHVSAIFVRLGVTTRAEAIAAHRP